VGDASAIGEKHAPNLLESGTESPRASRIFHTEPTQVAPTFTPGKLKNLAAVESLDSLAPVTGAYVRAS
jgi:hypothetical protein